MATKFGIGRLTALPAAGVRAWRSLRSTRQRIEAGVAFTAAVGCIVAAAIQVAPAFATEKIEGAPVPDELLSAIAVGATSCPALTGPRLAAQLMYASEFKPAQKSETGEGLADLDADAWKTWAPWPDAQRTDTLANVLALSHRTCKNAGQARSAGVEDEQWEAAVAVDIAGLDAVKQAKGVPDSAKKDVETVAGYANWYADQKQFAAPEETEAADTTVSATAAVQVPDEYVDLVVKAGRTCSAILPPERVAAQLMALSQFNPNLRGPDGGQGIAQFNEKTWETYRPSASASVWDPKVAIPAMATAICDLKNQLSGMKVTEGTNDPYTLALTAFRLGVTAVRAEGGVPRTAAVVSELPDKVTGYLETYAADTRLAGKPSAPKPSASPSPSPSETPSEKPSAKPSESTETTKPAEEPKPEETTPSAPKPKQWNSGDRWQLIDALNNRVADVPGNDDLMNSGTTIQLWDNQNAKDQYWNISNVQGAEEFVNIVNANTGKALGIRDGSGDNGAELVMLDRNNGDQNQQWTMKQAGNDQWFIVNRHTGKALDIIGDDNGGANGTPITQWDMQDYAVDQHWKLSK